MQIVGPDPADRVRQLLAGGETDAAVASAIESYGPEILGFLVAVIGDPDTADDVFSMFCEDVWRGLDGFRWEGPLRSWLYTLCRRAWVRYRRSAYQRNRHGLSVLGTLSKIAVNVLTLTHERGMGGSPTQVARLRDQLSEDERAVLILRIDRGLSWNEIAQSMDDGDEPLADEALRRQAAVLRKRFERIKERLRVLAKEAGLLPEP